MSQLPQKFQDWFAGRGWSPRAHQLAILEHAMKGESALLISPTGGGKTLAGFLPSLVELSEAHERKGIHTLYISPLKALAVDIARNLEAPVLEMGLPITIETRTGDTPHSRRKRQRRTSARHSDHHAGTGFAADCRCGGGAYAAPSQSHHSR